MSVRRPLLPGDEVTWVIRTELQRMDRELVEVLAERLELVRRLWAHKRAVGLPLEDRDQEVRVLRRARRAANRIGIEPTFVEGIFRTVIAEGKRIAAPLPLPPPRLSVTEPKARTRA